MGIWVKALTEEEATDRFQGILEQNDFHVSDSAAVERIRVEIAERGGELTEGDIDEMADEIVEESKPKITVKPLGDTEDAQLATKYVQAANEYLVLFDELSGIEGWTTDKNSLSNPQQKALDYAIEGYEPIKDALNEINQSINAIGPDINTFLAAIKSNSKASLPEGTKTTIKQVVDLMKDTMPTMEEVSNRLQAMRMVAFVVFTDPPRLLQELVDKKEAIKSVKDTIDKLQKVAKEQGDTLNSDAQVELAQFFSDINTLHDLLRSRKDMIEAIIKMLTLDLQKGTLRPKTRSAIQQYTELTDDVIAWGDWARNILGIIGSPKLQAAQEGSKKVDIPTIKMTEVVPGLSLKDWTSDQLRRLKDVGKIVEKTDGGLILSQNAEVR